MAEAELAALGESLQDQLVTVNRLRAELEEERKAAASGVEEALSMIMRLQEEKAAEKMEACQYKRMAEEKMHHAEESMAVLNEVIFQKEMEIASLKYQVQNYKHKLLITGAEDFGSEPVKPNAYPCLKKGSSFASNKNLNRNISLPAIRLQELLSDVDTTDAYCLLLHHRQLTPMDDVVCQKHIMEEYNAKDVDMGSGGIMEEYDTNKVHNFFKEFRPEPTIANRRSKQSIIEAMNLEEDRDQSWHPDEDIFDKSTFQPRTNEENVTCVHSQDKHPGNRSIFTSQGSRIVHTRSDGNAVSSTGFQDIYEIQDRQNGGSFCGSNNEMPQDTSSRAKSINSEPDPLLNQDMSFKSYLCTNYENNSAEQPEDAFQKCQECRSRIMPYLTDIEQLKERMQRLEDYVRNMKQEDQEIEEEESDLLKRVVEHLDMIRTHFKKPKPMFDYNQDDECILHLAEAMACFWL